MRTVFDGYADSFDAHLISLGYRVPGLIRAALIRHPAMRSDERLGPALDLGCGTGLAAVALSDLSIGPFIGVDLSSRMLARAAATQLYNELREADIVQMLSEDTGAWPLIIAADVLCYFGDLQEIFAHVSQRLNAKGWFVCSVEELLPDHGQCHSREWRVGFERAGSLCARSGLCDWSGAQTGLKVRTLERQTLRYEADAPVHGIFVVLERA